MNGTNPAAHAADGQVAGQVAAGLQRAPVTATSGSGRAAGVHRRGCQHLEVLPPRAGHARLGAAAAARFAVGGLLALPRLRVRLLLLLTPDLLLLLPLEYAEPLVRAELVGLERVDLADHRRHLREHRLEQHLRLLRHACQVRRVRSAAGGPGSHASLLRRATGRRRAQAGGQAAQEQHSGGPAVAVGVPHLGQPLPGLALAAGSCNGLVRVLSGEGCSAHRGAQTAGSNIGTGSASQRTES